MSGVGSGGISPHHADENLRCPVCKIAWPCPPFQEARRRKPFGPVVIPVNAQREAASAAGRGTR